MLITKWLKQNTKKLGEAGISTARLDCLVLLEDTTGKERAWLLAHPKFALDEKLVKMLNEQVKRRAEHEPLAYIRNKTEFYGREFYIDPRVLEPRPESETMIELFHEAISGMQLADHSPIIADLGTGSGALAITAKLLFPNARVIATDIDKKCLEVAGRNAKTFNVPIEFLGGDLLEPLNAEHYGLTVILANLPYVPNEYRINTAAMKEPRLAIFGGPDGLDLYRRMFDQLKDLKQRPRFILTESMPPQHDALAEIAHVASYKLKKTDDFIQLFTNN